MSVPVYEPFKPIYDGSTRWIISNQDEASVIQQMKQFAYPRSIDEQRLRPYVVYNKDTKRVWYHAQASLNGTNQVTTEWEYVFTLIKQTFGAKVFTKSPLIVAACMMSSAEVEQYLQQYPQATQTP